MSGSPPAHPRRVEEAIQYFVVAADAFIFRTRSSMDLWERALAPLAGRLGGGAGSGNAVGSTAEDAAKAAHGEAGGCARATGSSSTWTTGSSQRGASLMREGGCVTASSWKVGGVTSGRSPDAAGGPSCVEGET
jgi:hypothetical protein